MASDSPTRINQPGRVLVVVQDLIFGVRIAEAARAAGFQPIEAGLMALPTAVDDGVALVVVDTGQRGDWETAIRALKADASTAAVPILAYGSHVDVTASRAAVAAGVD